MSKMKDIENIPCELNNSARRIDYLERRVFDLEGVVLKVKVMSDQIIDLHRMIVDMKKENK